MSTTGTPQAGGLRPARRTIVKGAAWAVPAVTIASAAPAMASSPCEPTFTALPGSIKCCNGSIKTMKIIIQVTNTSGCVEGSTEQVCINSVQPDTGNASVGTTTFAASACTTDGGTITVYLYDVSNCTVNLIVGYSIAGAPTEYVALKSGNIADSDGECSPDDAPAADEKTADATVEEPAPAPGPDTEATTAGPNG